MYLLYDCLEMLTVTMMFCLVYLSILKIYNVRVSKFKLFIISLPTAIIYSLLYYLVPIFAKLSERSFLFSIFNIMEVAVFIRLLLIILFIIKMVDSVFKLSYRKTFFYVFLMLHIFIATGTFMSSVLLLLGKINVSIASYYDNKLTYFLIIMGIEIISHIISYLAICVLDKRIHFFSILNEVINTPIGNDRLLKLFPLYCYLIPMIRIINKNIFRSQNGTLVGGILIIIIFIFIFIFFVYSVVADNKKQKLITLQQQTYINQLEDLQKDLRAFKHDYKNILSGAYLYAQNDETEKIRLFFENAMNDFNQQVNHQLNFAVQLGNVHLQELKSLLLLKLQKIHQESIPYHIEILNPIKETSMNINDLNRCLGILIDNAIEANGNALDKYIEITLIKDFNKLSIIIKNKYHEKITDLSNLNTEGYSSKGKNRGIGLSSYNQLINKYKNIVSSTSIKDNFFIQEMIILDD